MVYTYEYDSAYDGPTMPVVEIDISANSRAKEHLVLTALVDSGADATMIPARHLRRIRARYVDKKRIRDSAYLSYLVDIHHIAIRIGPFYHARLEVIANRQSNDVILGRDVLNHMIVTLNGLAHMVELSN
jgi:predicted aspartyl protease